ncbi:MAG: hypothetical protein BA864_02010 [Desulfuromonadales bacterium C00003093]|nr:MAG: hypothetical protein BA864_02010 [Desulfuromonadales bacterium C00003093]
MILIAFIQGKSFICPIHLFGINHGTGQFLTVRAILSKMQSLTLQPTTRLLHLSHLPPDIKGIIQLPLIRKLLQFWALNYLTKAYIISQGMEKKISR